MNTPFRTSFLMLLVFVLSFTGCTGDFEEMNTNPNEPVKVPPETIFPYGLREASDRIYGHRTRLERLGLDGGMLWVQYFARNQYTIEGDTYNPDASMRNNNWEGFFNESLINFQKVIELSSDPEGEYYSENYVAVAMVMRAYLFSIVTDTWGSIPYTEALTGSTEGNLAPSYTSQEEIYAGMLANLKIASDKLQEAGEPLQADILFGGDIMRWKKFANALRLRLAVRQYSKKPAESSTIISEIVGNPDIYPLFENNQEFALLYHESRLGDDNNNSWHEIMVIDGREDWSISNTLIAAMTDGNGNATDPRLTIYAEQAIAGDFEGKYAGAPNGLPESMASIYINTASRPGRAFSQETSPVTFLSYSEQLFLLSEAALNGIALPYSAKEYLDMAITASFDYYELAVPSGYLDDKVADLETIMTEKWKALFGQGIEAWIEYRRTGYPVLPKADPNAIFENDGQVPTRLRYPESEYSLNGNNVAEGAQLNGGPDDKLTKLWWAH